MNSCLGQKPERTKEMLQLPYGEDDNTSPVTLRETLALEELIKRYGLCLHKVSAMFSQQFLIIPS